MDLGIFLSESHLIIFNVSFHWAYLLQWMETGKPD